MFSMSYMGEELLNSVSEPTHSDINRALTLSASFQTSKVARIMWTLRCWYEEPVNTQKTITFVMMYSHCNKVGIQASKFHYICYESYLKGVQFSFKVLCLLQSIYA